MPDVKVRITRVITLHKDISIPFELVDAANADETGDVYNDDISEKYWPSFQFNGVCDDWEMKDEYWDVVEEAKS